METTQTCPECGAVWKDGLTCEEHFHQMLYWENEFPDYGVVHNLTVLSYYLQHPSLYSPEGLNHGMKLLSDFVEKGITTQEVRARDRDKVSSTNRTWKVKGKPGAQGAYSHPIRWSMTAPEVTAGGPHQYCENVRQWAAKIMQDIRESGNFPG